MKTEKVERWDGCLFSAIIDAEVVKLYDWNSGSLASLMTLAMFEYQLSRDTYKIV